MSIEIVVPRMWTAYNVRDLAGLALPADVHNPLRIGNRWGPRVQKGYRVSGVRRPGEKKPN